MANNKVKTFFGYYNEPSTTMDRWLEKNQNINIVDVKSQVNDNQYVLLTLIYNETVGL